ncbi:MAG: hypothetical protein R2861_11650 [Desulfobacterales bacterium]
MSRVIIDEVNHSMEVVVPDEAQSCHRPRQPERPAGVKAIRMEHDVKSITDYEKSIQMGMDSLMALPSMSKTLADILFGRILSVDELAKVSAEELAEVAGISDSDAMGLIDQAKQALTADPTEPEEPHDNDTEAEDPGPGTEPSENDDAALPAKDAEDAEDDPAAPEDDHPAE